MTCSFGCKLSSKTPIGVVSYISGSKRLAINLKNTEENWSWDWIDIDGIPNYTSYDTVLNDLNGKSNTAAWVAYWGADSEYAAGYCYNYTTSGTSVGEWYLPAEGELYASIWTNQSSVNSGLSAAGGTAIQNDFHWSSTEFGTHAAWIVRGSDGHITYDFDKFMSRYNVRCVLAF